MKEKNIWVARLNKTEKLSLKMVQHVIVQSFGDKIKISEGRMPVTSAIAWSVLLKSDSSIHLHDKGKSNFGWTS